MRKIYLLVASVFVGASVFGQTNLSYEDSVNHPYAAAGIPEIGTTNGWALGLYDASTDFSNGAQSVKLTTVTNANFAMAGLPTQLPGQIFQDIDIDATAISNNGADITGTVDVKTNLLGNAAGLDSALIIFEAYDTLAAGSADDVLLYSGSLIITQNTSTWTTVPLSMEDAGNTGTINSLVIGGMSGYKRLTDGSTLMLDNWTIDLGYLSVNNTSNVTFSAYPNPTKNVLNITASEEVSSVSILSLDGKVVTTSTSNTVDVSALTNGVYMYEVTTVNGKKAINKFVKE
ncbi:MAG: T9SS type A sorting domain-containing protein [Crocinitomicaceae bacterium]